MARRTSSSSPSTGGAGQEEQGERIQRRVWEAMRAGYLVHPSFIVRSDEFLSQAEFHAILFAQYSMAVRKGEWRWVTGLQYYLRRFTLYSHDWITIHLPHTDPNRNVPARGLEDWVCPPVGDPEHWHSAQEIPGPRGSNPRPAEKESGAGTKPRQSEETPSRSSPGIASGRRATSPGELGGSARESRKRTRTSTSQDVRNRWGTSRDGRSSTGTHREDRHQYPRTSWERRPPTGSKQERHKPNPRGTSQAGHSSTDRGSGTSRHKKKGCVVQGCGHVSTKPKWHVYSHLPWCFQEYPESDFPRPELSHVREACLKYMAEQLVGSPSLDALVRYVDEKIDGPVGELQPRGLVEIRAFARALGWNCPALISLSPLNTHAALIHWRILGFLYGRLDQDQRRYVYVLGLRPSTLRNRQPAAATQNRPEGQQGSEMPPPSTPVPECPPSSSSAGLLGSMASRPDSPMDTQPPRTTESRGSAVHLHPPIIHAGTRLGPVGAKTGVADPTQSAEQHCPAQSPHVSTGWSPLVESPMGPHLLGVRSSVLGSSVSTPGHPTSDQPQSTVADSPRPGLRTAPPTSVGNRPSPEVRDTQESSALGATMKSEDASPSVPDKSASSNLGPLPKLGSEGTTIIPVAPSGAAKSANEYLEVVDSHCHLDRLEDRLGLSGMDTLAAIPGRYPKVPVSVVGGVLNYCDPYNFSRISCPRDPRWGVAVGIHPKHASRVKDQAFLQLQAALKNEWVCAVSEVGLDFSANGGSWDKQLELLRRILAMNITEKVLVLHLRGSKLDPVATDASRRTFKEIEGNCSREQRIHIHCCMLDISEIEKWRGAFPYTHFGFTGAIQRFGVVQRRALKSVPLERLLLESDAPYFVPDSRVRVNTPVYLGEVASLVAEIRGEPLQVVVEATRDNARQLYSLKY